MTTIRPIKLTGNWFEGYALDIHTVSSTFIGNDEFGHEVFDTKRSGIGELLYQLKYKSDKSSLDEIVAVTVNFLNNQWQVSKNIHAIIPVPPSKRRAFQPVIQLARSIGSALHIPSIENYLIKVKQTPEIKNVYDYQQRLEILGDAFAVRNLSLTGKNVLLFDDLYRSGATLHAITRTLYEKGQVNQVCILALTKTRSKS